MKDPYDILGVSRTATAPEIQSAYRKLAKQLHPDLNPGDAAAEEKFKEVAAAYDLLGDAEKRRRFDAGEIDAAGSERPPQQQQQHYYRDYAAPGHDNPYADAAGYADFMEGDDAFAELLRRSRSRQANRRGADVTYRLAIDFTESIVGGSKRITMPDGGTLDVKLPPGLVDGQTLRLKGKGAPGLGTGAAGDALIEIEVLPDKRFVREGDDLYVELPISLTEAVLGGKIRVPTPSGEVAMTVPKGANTGTLLRLKGKGAPKRGGGHGDELVRLKLVLSDPKDPALEAFVAGWSRDQGFDPRTQKGAWS